MVGLPCPTACQCLCFEEPFSAVKTAPTKAAKPTFVGWKSTQVDFAIW
ncbi:MAG: hypothetical protein Q8N45_08850 [Anaerolineales bacterium]|nr:hypothetical protein [Anaerolineales bacterium]